jgi:hypothetical protein
MIEATSVSASEGLIHLGAMATVISLAYLGLDRVGYSDAEFRGKLESIRMQIGEVFSRLDISRDDTYFWEHPAYFPYAYLLMYAAGMPTKLRGVRYLLFRVQREMYFPFLWYFRERYDSAVMPMVSSVVTIAYLVIVGSLLRGYDVFVLPHFSETCFYLFGGAIVFSLFNVVAGRGKEKIDRTCQRLFILLQANTDTELRAVLESAYIRVSEFSSANADDRQKAE